MPGHRRPRPCPARPHLRRQGRSRSGVFRRGQADCGLEIPGGKGVSTAPAAAEEDVFVADAGNSIVWRFDINGKLKGRIGEPEQGVRNYPGFPITSHYFPLTLGSDGLLHVVNPRASAG